MLFLLRFFLALPSAGQTLWRWPHWNPRYSTTFVERRQEPLPFAAKLIPGRFVESGTRLRPFQVEGRGFGASVAARNQVSRPDQNRPPAPGRAIRTVNISLGLDFDPPREHHPRHRRAPA